MTAVLPNLYTRKPGVTWPVRFVYATLQSLLRIERERVTSNALSVIRCLQPGLDTCYNSKVATLKRPPNADTTSRPFGLSVTVASRGNPPLTRLLGSEVAEDPSYSLAAHNRPNRVQITWIYPGAVGITATESKFASMRGVIRSDEK